MQKQVNISLTVGLADVFADRANIDHEFSVMLAVADHLPFAAVKLDIDSKRQDERAFGDLAAGVVTPRGASRELVRRTRLSLGLIGQAQRVIRKNLFACGVTLSAEPFASDLRPRLQIAHLIRDGSFSRLTSVA